MDKECSPFQCGLNRHRESEVFRGRVGEEWEWREERTGRDRESGSRQSPCFTRGPVLSLHSDVGNNKISDDADDV